MEMITKTNFYNKSKSISHPFGWETPPNRVSIKPGDVHIWKVDLKVITAHQLKRKGDCAIFTNVC